MILRASLLIAATVTAALGPVPAAIAQEASCSAPRMTAEAPADPQPKAKHSKKPRPSLDDPTPSLQPQTLDCTRQAAERYAKIASDGGWPQVAARLNFRSRGTDINALRRRLSLEGDLSEKAGENDSWSDEVSAALRAFQQRAGLPVTGKLDPDTLAALNVPADVRARELAASADRLAGMKLTFGDRYVVANIPSATVEAVEKGRVVHRYVAVAGDRDHQSPSLTTTIRSVTINPTWTIPRSIVEAEVLPKIRKSRRYLDAAQIQILDRKGREVDPRRVDWSEQDGAGLTFRQDPGAKNSLGHIRIDMPNREAVYMHDTPERRKFAQDYRFLSHGCVRVDGIIDLASWLLNENAKEDWTDKRFQSVIKEEDTRRVPLHKAIPVAWVYMTAWADASGTVHFRPDVYDTDGADDAQMKKTARR
jgi:murein L,D-transpeptidase YcbB/YkuD